MSSPQTAVLALDVHGGDGGAAVCVPAAVAALQAEPTIQVILVGNPDEIESQLERLSPSLHKRIQIESASHVLANDAKPTAVLRRGKDSSMWNAFALVAGDRAHACISAGSTAAMMVLGVRLIGMLPGIERPALMAYLPTLRGSTGLLDVGANMNVSAEQLVQFAVMGAVSARNVAKTEQPSIGLLNVGHEDSKGHDLVRKAHEMLNELPLNYAGFIEGHDLFEGKVDIAVCDGFAGNLVLKSSEGLARMFVQEMKSALLENPVSKLGAMLAGPSLRRWLARRDPSAHNGAPLLGLKGVAVKSHGNADCKGMTQAILEAGREVRRQVPERIGNSIHTYHLETQS
jgi:glycerol-3-phosphate acyltransferase PlsX